MRNVKCELHEKRFFYFKLVYLFRILEKREIQELNSFIYNTPEQKDSKAKLPDASKRDGTFNMFFKLISIYKISIACEIITL